MQIPPRKKQTHWPHPTAQKDPKRVSVLFLFHVFLSWHARARPILAAAVPRAALARPSGAVLVFSGVLLRSPEFSCVLSRSLAFCSVLLSSACSNHTAASCWWTNSSALPVIFGALGAPGCSPGSPRRKQRQIFWVEDGPPPAAMTQGATMALNATASMTWMASDLQLPRRSRWHARSARHTHHHHLKRPKSRWALPGLPWSLNTRTTQKTTATE